MINKDRELELLNIPSLTDSYTMTMKKLTKLLLSIKGEEEAELLSVGIIRAAKKAREEGWDSGYKEGIETLQGQIRGLLNINEPSKPWEDNEQ